MRDIEQIITASVVLSSGDVLRSRYRILNQLGIGEVSRTYLAEDLNRFSERCVLKEFAPQLKGTFIIEKAQELFEREAGVLYRLKHAQIAQFRQLFCHEREDLGCLFLVQDYVEGVTYRDLQDRRLSRDECFTEAEIRQLLAQVLPILEDIHSMGVIHRDISPDNLILRRRDELPVLIDFGCIKEVEIKTQSELSIMHSPMILSIATAFGKAGYSPPEQVERGIVYAYSDLYALAATAVVLLTDKKPQQLINSQDNRWHWRSRYPLSPKLEWILNTMLSSHSSDRFGSAAEVIKTLQDIVITPATIPPHSKASQPLEAAFAPIRRKAIAAGIKPLSSVIGAWHYRYATSGSAPSALETHWHEWMSGREQKVWRFTGTEWQCEAKNVHHRITHNGDFDSWKLFNRDVDNCALGLWLERVLHTPNATKGDSPKIAGIMDLLLTQGIWSASVRWAYQQAIATAVENAFDGQQPAADALNTAPDNCDINVWANIFESAFTAELSSLRPCDAEKIAPKALESSSTLQQAIAEVLKQHTST